jgi:uncharacterized DUF497 family protein/predicted DNA binding CopG/RHH family protein
MDEIRFEWDPQKAAVNVAKHGVTFDEAVSVFSDDGALLLDDPYHSVAEERFILLGLSAHLRLLVVVLLSRGRCRDQAYLGAQSNEDRAAHLRDEELLMRDQYDCSRARRNPYAGRLKKPITIRLDEPTIAYFKDLAEEVGLPYQSLINLYLRDCAAKRRRLSMTWRASKREES